MDLALLFGLASAVAYGTGDYLWQHAGRAVGLWRGSFYGALAGLAVLSFWLLMEPAQIRHALAAPAAAWIGCIASAVALATASILLTQALIHGTLAVVAPVTASYGAVTAVLAALGGERFSGMAPFGLVLVIAAAQELRGPDAPRARDCVCQGSAASGAPRAWHAASSCSRPSDTDESVVTPARAVHDGQVLTVKRCAPPGMCTSAVCTSRREASSLTGAPTHVAGAFPRVVCRSSSRAALDRRCVCQDSPDVATARKAGHSLRCTSVSLPLRSLVRSTSR
jgi:uncharacterized membrane protein